MGFNFRKSVSIALLFIGSMSMNAQSLGGILKNATSSVSSSTSLNNSSTFSGLTSIFSSSKAATKDKVIGTWIYTEPAVVFSSNNVLKNMGGKAVASAIGYKLQTQFAKIGIKKGSMKIVFDKKGNFSQIVGSKKMTGTYSISGANVVLKYGGTTQQMIGTTQMIGNDLLIVMDASRLLKYAKTVGALTGNSTLNTVGSLVSSYNGLQVGIKLNK
jgi:hypothetical protein